MASGSREEDPLLQKSAEPLKLRAIMAISVACLAGIHSHHCLASSNGIMGPVMEDFKFNDNHIQIFMSLVIIASIPGAVSAGWIADKIGRVMTLNIGMSLYFVGAAQMTFSTNWFILMFGRVLSGIAFGMTVVVVPLYISEVAPARIRGMLCALGIELSFNSGSLITSCWSAFFAYIRPHYNYGMGRGWRWICGIGLPVPLIVCALASINAESPRWLASKRRFEEAKRNFNLLFGPNEARVTYEKLVAQSQQEERPGDGREPGMLELLTAKRTRVAVIAGCGSAFFGQAVGVEVFSFYLSYILMESGWSYTDSLRAGAVVLTLNLVAIVVCSQFVDSWGRRPLLLLSAAGVTLSTLLIAFSLYIANAWSAYLTLTGVVMYYQAFFTGWGPIPYTLNTEVYPMNCRTKGLVLATVISRGFGAVLVGTFLTLVRLLGVSGTFVFYSLINLSSFFFVLVCVPETKGMSLEDAEQLMSSPGECTKNCVRV